MYGIKYVATCSLSRRSFLINAILLKLQTSNDHKCAFIILFRVVALQNIHENKSFVACHSRDEKILFAKL